MLKKGTSGIFAIAVCTISGTAHAVPVAAQSAIGFNYYNFSTPVSEVHPNTSAESFVSTGFQGFAKLSTGKVGSLVDGTKGATTNFIVRAFDTLQYSANATISFKYTYEGYFSSRSIYSDPYSQTRVDIYDITGLSSWLELEPFFGIDELSVSDAATPVVGVSALLKFSDHEFRRNGRPNYVKTELTGAFVVDPARTYGISIISNSHPGGSTGIADFSHTGTFEFTELNGATFTSGSGVFLTQQVDIPEPSLIGLFGISVGMLAFARRHRTA